MTEQIEMNNTIPQPIQYEKIEKYNLKPAGFWIRFWAYLFDLLVISALTGILIKPFFRLLGLSLTETVWYAPIVILSGVLFYTYFVLMTKFFGQTLGKMILGIRVISPKEEKLSWVTILFRECIGRFFSATIPVIYWMVGFTPNKSALHDYIADTMVVHEKTYEKRIFHVKREIDNVSQLQQSETI